ncbi:MAG: hypothetical protein ACRDOK_16540 [Streptosporangiaceae bacterium]
MIAHWSARAAGAGPAVGVRPVLWMGMLPPLITAAVALLSQWLNDEESAELSAGLIRLTAAPGRLAIPASHKVKLGTGSRRQLCMR